MDLQKTRIKENVDSVKVDLPAVKTKRRLVFEVTANTSTLRQKSPTVLTDEGKLNVPQRNASRRQLETLVAATEVNGGSVEDRSPALDGMFSTLTKYAKTAALSKYFSSSKKMRKASLAVIKPQVKQYKQSDHNVIRSLSMLYAGGLMGKVKYKQTRSALVMKNTKKHTKKLGSVSKERVLFGMGIPIPKLLPDGLLMKKIEEIDVGEFYSIRETLCHDLPPDQQLDGVYRNLENFLLLLAKFCFETDQYRKPGDKLVWFSEREGAFKVAIGGDGAPFGKWDQSMSWLISFLNVRPRVASPNDNFLLFGANCKEDHMVVSRFTVKLATDMEKIESKSYTVLGKNVTFSFDLLPGDMKFLAYINGELSNAAKYFSSFANVSKDDCNALNGKYGESHDCKWKPWQYAERINVAKQVEDFKRKKYLVI